MSRIIYVLLILQINLLSFSQGCSDAGLCSIGSMQSATSIFDLSLEELMNLEVADNHYHNKMIATQIISVGENATSILTTELEANINWGTQAQVLVKVPYTYTNGDLGSTSRLADISIGLTRELMSKGDYFIDGTVAIRLPTNQADLKAMGRDLPMPYQTSLGTYDLVIGASALLPKWHFATGYQQVLIHANTNSYMDSSITIVDSAAPYFYSKNLKRGNDLMLRAERIIKWKKLTFFVGVMPIIRLNADRVEYMNREVRLNGSRGITFNLTAASLIPISEKSTLRINMGSPAHIRKTRSDGLTRALVMMFGWEYKL